MSDKSEAALLHCLVEVHKKILVDRKVTSVRIAEFVHYVDIRTRGFEFRMGGVTLEKFSSRADFTRCVLLKTIKKYVDGKFELKVHDRWVSEYIK